MYEDMVLHNRSELIEREEIEWANFWYDRANEHPSHRILLMGDSTARLVRSTMAKMTETPVDLFATSSSFHDSLFIHQLDCFFTSEYQYDVAFVQFGHHGELGFGGGLYKEEDWEIFRKEFRTFLDYLKTKVPRIIVESIFYSVIPQKKTFVNKVLLKCFHKKEQFDDEVNSRKNRKTKIMFEVAREMGIETLDINNFMLTEGKRFIHTDHIHYEENAKVFICNRMKECLRNENS